MTTIYARHSSMSRLNSSFADNAGTHQGLQTRRSTQKNSVQTLTKPDVPLSFFRDANDTANSKALPADNGRARLPSSPFDIHDRWKVLSSAVPAQRWRQISFESPSCWKRHCAYTLVTPDSLTSCSPDALQHRTRSIQNHFL